MAAAMDTDLGSCRQRRDQTTKIRTHVAGSSKSENSRNPQNADSMNISKTFGREKRSPKGGSIRQQIQNWLAKKIKKISQKDSI